MRAPPRRVLLAAQWIAAALVLYYVGRTLAAQWIEFRSTPLDAHPRWLLILASGALFLATHALLVQTWRMMLTAWNASLSFWQAARIWSVSNFGKYVPGKVWQITAVGYMASKDRVSPAIAAGSALLSTIVNIASGIAIVLVIGWRWLATIHPDARAIAIALVVGAALGLAMLPYLLPRVARALAKLTGRELSIEGPPQRTVSTAIIGNTAAWLTYGIAFMWLVRGVLGDSPGATWQYVAVYTASYVVGYLFFFVPGGIGPREWVMVQLLTALQLATYKQALLVAAASRVWLTILEIVPGLVFVARDAARRRSSSPQPPDAPTA